ncbi:putative T6SS immunity periplasmic lipoprotein [Enterobacteriaceae bacterium LUAb1]
MSDQDVKDGSFPGVAAMIMRNLLLVTVLCSLAGCWMGDYHHPSETTVVKKTNAGLCFKVNDPGDYRLATLGIKLRDDDEGFFRKMPALSITDEQLCIPDSYYHFPKNGDYLVDYTLRSPTKVKELRYVVTALRMTDGEFQQLRLRYSELSTPDAEGAPE